MASKKFKLDVFISLASAPIKLITALWMIKEAEFVLATTILGLFLFSRRLSSTGANLFQLGISQTLIKYLSENNDHNNKKNFITTALLIWVTVSFLVVLIMILFQTFFGTFFFPEAINPEELMVWIAFYSVLIPFGFIMNAILITERKIILYNLLEIFNTAVLALLSIFFYKSINDVTPYIRFQVIGMSIMYGLTFLFFVYKYDLLRLPNSRALRKVLIFFSTYGVTRSLITFSDMFLIMIGAFLIRDNVEVVAYFLIAISLTKIIPALLQPLTQLAGVLTGQNSKVNPEKMAMGLNLLLGSVVYLSVLLSIILINWNDVLIPLWLSDVKTINSVIYSFNILVIGLVPFSIYHSIKRMIDVRYTKPLNLISLVIALVIHVITYYFLNFFFNDLISISISLCLSFFVLGIFSIAWMKQYINKTSYFKVGWYSLLMLLLYFLNYYLHYLNSGIAMFLIASFFTFVLTALFLYSSKSQFSIELKKLI